MLSKIMMMIETNALWWLMTD